MPDQPSRITREQWFMIALLGASATAAFLYRFLRQPQFGERLGHSAALFLGIPVVLGVVLALTPKATSATGGIVKGITFALLVLAPLLGEGMVCILFASPLFYLVGILIGVATDTVRRDAENEGTRLTCVALLLLPMCFEGTVPQLTFPRRQTVETHRLVAATSQAVEARLAQPPRLDTPLQLPLRIGFPVPLTATGTGLAVGDMRTIHFSGVEHAPPGDLVLRVTQSEPGHVRFVTIADTTKLAHWLHWQSSDVTWQPASASTTNVIWRVTFERELDPAWYFNAWQRVFVQQAAAYLIQANATPPAR